MSSLSGQFALLTRILERARRLPPGRVSAQPRGVPPSRRRSSLVEDCACLSIKDFVDADDYGRSWHKRGVLLGGEPLVDFHWGVDVLGSNGFGVAQVLFDVYRPGSRRRPGRLKFYDTEPGARIGLDLRQGSATVQLVGVPSPVGQVRRYFLCPGCHRRCSALYVKPESMDLRCIRCHRLRYQSQG